MRVRRVTTTTMRKQFSEVLNRAAFAGERVVVHRHGKDIAAFVPIADLRLLEEAEDKLDLKTARERMREAGELVPWKKIKAELGL